MRPHHLPSRALLYFSLNPNPSFLLQVSHFSTQSSNFHSHHHHLSHSSRRYEDESRNVRVSVWWDFENCHIPAGVNVFRVAQTITAAVRANGMKGPVQITAFGDVLQLSRANQEALSSTGINLTHIPNGGKNSADRSLLVDLLYWISRNPPPAHLFLISGDRDFAGILHRLRMNNYNILLAGPEKAPGVLCSAASIMWHWNLMIKGEDLIGKLYNQPPDGPHGSWYGHYKAPLEDPFAVPEQPPPPVKNEDPHSPASDPSSEIKVRPVPKLIMRSIYNILKVNPEGMPITDLRDELKSKNLMLDRDLYGHKKFSRFLLSMPHILKLKFQPDGQYLVQPATVKHSQPSDSIKGLSSGPSVESGEVQDQKTTPLKVDSEERSSDKDEIGKPETGVVAKGSPKKVKQQTSTGRNKPMSVPEKKVSEGVDTQVREDNVLSVSEEDSTPRVGLFRRVWGRWFGDTEQPESEHSTSSDQSIERSGKEEAVKVVAKDVDIASSESPSLPNKALSIKVEGSEESERRGFFRRIVSWCKFRGATTSEPEPAINQSNEDTLYEKKTGDLAKDQIFSQESLWNDLRSCLDSLRGSCAVSQSRNRSALAKNLRKVGPAALGKLSETDLLRLIDLLISDKKLIEENPSKPFPFSLSQRHSQGPKGLRSIFSDNKLSENEVEQKVNNNVSHTGVSSPVVSKTPSDQSRNQILADVHKLVQDLLVQNPDGFYVANFRRLFLEKYQYPLDLQKLGYLKVTGLLQVIPGVAIESGLMVRSSRTAQSVGSSDGEESSDSWDELGPLAKESSAGKAKLPEYEPALLDEEEVSSGSEDDQGGRNKKQKSADDDSSLIQILDSWYSKECDGGRDNTKPEQADGLHLLSENSFELLPDKRQRQQKKVYSFVADASGGGEREKQVDGILGSLKKTADQRMQQQA